LQFVQWHCC